MVVRYDPGYHSDNSLYDLELVDITGTATYQPTFGKLSTLIQWHLQDPVDAFEQNRNEVAFGYQGTDESVDLGLVEELYIAALSMEILPHTNLAIEYSVGEDYSISDGGTGDDIRSATMQLAVEF